MKTIHAFNPLDYVEKWKADGCPPGYRLGAGYRCLDPEHVRDDDDDQHPQGDGRCQQCAIRNGSGRWNIWRGDDALMHRVQALLPFAVVANSSDRANACASFDVYVKTGESDFHDDIRAPGAVFVFVDAEERDGRAMLDGPRYHAQEFDKPYACIETDDGDAVIAFILERVKP